MVTPTPSLQDLRQRAADEMAAYHSLTGGDRTNAAKRAALALVEARQLFQARDGSPDILGRSHDYRAFVTEAQDLAGIPGAERASLQAALRYHISPLLRERFAEEVEKMGLSEGNALERARRRKERDARVVSLFAGGSELTDANTISDAANLSRLAVSRVAGWPEGTPVEQQERILEEYRNLAAAVNAAIARLS